MRFDEVVVAFWMYPVIAMLLVLAVAVGYFFISIFRRKKSGSTE